MIIAHPFALIRRLAFSYLVVLTACHLMLPNTLGAAEDETTIIFVRHADRMGSEDALTEEGRQRAVILGELAKTLRVSSIYSTETNRTQETAKPAAAQLDLEIKPYNFVPDRPDPAWFRELLRQNAGETVLIVGHSNTLDGLIRGFGGAGSYPLGHHEYDRLFIATIRDGETEVASIRFGARASGDED